MLGVFVSYVLWRKESGDDRTYFGWGVDPAPIQALRMVQAVH